MFIWKTSGAIFLRCRYIIYLVFIFSAILANFFSFITCVIVQLAEILKQLYPNLVTMHSYQQKNSVKSKYSNWSVLNKKVLSKISLALTEKEMLRLSNTEPGAIEDVLFRLMTIDNSDREAINLKQAIASLDDADQCSIFETTASVVSEGREQKYAIL